MLKYSYKKVQPLYAILPLIDVEELDLEEEVVLEAEVAEPNMDSSAGREQEEIFAH